MSFATGLLSGIADGKNRSNDRKKRERELAILESDATERRSVGAPYANPNSPEAVAHAAANRGGGGGGATIDLSKIDPAIRDGIYETAQELGVSPQHVATIISYETGGTFDPRQKGPVTQWGQHEGLIQWGEPQAKENGVNWDDPINSQLGKDGAIVRYMRNAGVKPGMGLEDLYSAVNAGRVGRPNASDANNGGAPGTVRDKVQDQMSGHMANATAMFDGYTPASVAPARPRLSMGIVDPQPTAFRWFENLRNTANGAR